MACYRMNFTFTFFIIILHYCGVDSPSVGLSVYSFTLYLAKIAYGMIVQ